MTSGRVDNFTVFSRFTSEIYSLQPEISRPTVFLMTTTRAIYNVPIDVSNPRENHIIGDESGTGKIVGITG